MLSTITIMAATLLGSVNKPKYGNKIGKPKSHKTKAKAKISAASRIKNRR